MPVRADEAGAGRETPGMPRIPRALPAELGPVFTRAEAGATGVTDRRLRARDLQTPFRGVRRRPQPEAEVPDGPLARDAAARAAVLRTVEAYLPVMAPGAFVCARSAAILFGGPVSPGPDLDIGVLDPARAPRRVGVRGRKLAPHLVHVVRFDDVPISSPASTWAMLAAELTVDDLIRLGDALVRVPRDRFGTPRPRRRLATPEQLRNAADAGRRIGGGKLRAALEEIRVGSMSPLETDFRLVTCRAGLPEPDLDVEIRDGSGRLVGIADAAYRARRVLVEVEGDHHRVDARQWARDLERHAAFAALGWHVVRLAGTHIRGPERRAVALVRAALERGARGE